MPKPKTASNPTTWKLAKMNLAIRGIEADLGDENADSFHRDLHKDLKAEYILAHQPFNMSDWGGDRLRDDSRWKPSVRETPRHRRARRVSEAIRQMQRQLPPAHQPTASASSPGCSTSSTISPRTP